MAAGWFTWSFWCFWNITNFTAKSRFGIRILQVAMNLAKAKVKMVMFSHQQVSLAGSRLMKRFVDNIDCIRLCRFWDSIRNRAYASLLVSPNRLARRVALNEVFLASKTSYPQLWYMLITTCQFNAYLRS